MEDLTKLGNKELKKEYNRIYNQLAFFTDDYEDYERETLLSKWEEIILELRDREDR